MHDLVVPDELSRERLQRHQGIAKEVLSFPVAAIRIIRRRVQGDVQNTALLIAAQNGPRVRPAAALPGISLPAVVTHLSRLRYAVEPPHQLPGLNIESTHVAARSQ